MDSYDHNSSEKAEAAELQRMIAIEQQKAQFQAQVNPPPSIAMLAKRSKPASIFNRGGYDAQINTFT